MSQVPAYRSNSSPELEAARAKERLRALSGKAHGANFRLPVFTLAAILLACLLMYLNIGRNPTVAPIGKPGCAAALHGHACK